MISVSRVPLNERKAVMQRTFADFSVHHRQWLWELVEKYKEHGVFPVFPTQIGDYYQDVQDKEIAILSTFAMKWDNGMEFQQMEFMRELIGEHPYQWFADREFASISVGRLQGDTIDGYKKGFYWKVAKMFDILHGKCKVRRIMKRPREVLTHKKYVDFCTEIGEVCELKDMEYKRDVVEMVLRTSGGIGRKLWPTVANVPKCPNSPALRKYMRTWFPYYSSRLWTWDEATRLFFDNGYDFFYSYYAYEALSEIDPVACRRYATRFKYRWDNQLFYTMKYWLGGWRIAPNIRFE